MRVKIHHEGNGILLIMLAIIAAVLVPMWLWVEPVAWPIAVSVVLGILFLLTLNFFRSPRRCFVGDPTDAVVASADGKVVALEEVFEDEFLHCRCIQLSVFMSIFNVHANWFPVNGIVEATAHNNGRFQAAYLPKSSTENERSAVLIRTADGNRVLVRQIAGAVARRIVTYAEAGNEANIEDHLGFIKFGSRVDLYLPLNSEIFVKIGDTTTGGITQVAKLHAPT
ncbi:MAG: phosphatidylserine decarboxylase family protein [Muribaculaceae bacterium]